MRNIFLLFLIVFCLEGCFFAAGAAAGAAGVAVVYDHRKLEKIIQDQQIASAVANKITANPDLRASHIEVTCFNQIILLTGETTSEELRQQAGTLAQETPEVTRVYNQITVKGPTSSLTRASDSWITAKIKTQMLATEGLQSGTIKVVTENGTVYLMGIVTREQANIAVDIARQVSGVQRVVKIFQYATEKPKAKAAEVTEPQSKISEPEKTAPEATTDDETSETQSDDSSTE
jgi:osmotically-inducible protein OsmY